MHVGLVPLCLFVSVLSTAYAPPPQRVTQGCYPGRYWLTCLINPCYFGGSCPGDKTARCRMERLGACMGCKAAWYTPNNERADCTPKKDLSLCPGGEPVVDCKVNACKWPCNHPEFRNAECKQSFCGRCKTLYRVQGQWFECPFSVSETEKFPIDTVVKPEVSKTELCQNLVSCSKESCRLETCPLYPGAICRPDGCQGCRPTWFVKDKIVNCHALPSDQVDPSFGRSNAMLDILEPPPGAIVQTEACARGQLNVECPVSVCDRAQCPRFKNAVCRPNGCGECHATWYVGGKLVDCEDKKCPPNVPHVRCVDDPCKYMSRYCPMAECRMSTCGKCEAKFYRNGQEFDCKLPPKQCPPGVRPLQCPWYECPANICPSNLRLRCRIDPCGATCSHHWEDVYNAEIRSCRTFDGGVIKKPKQGKNKKKKKPRKIFFRDPMLAIFDPLVPKKPPPPVDAISFTESPIGSKQGHQGSEASSDVWLTPDAGGAMGSDLGPIEPGNVFSSQLGAVEPDLPPIARFGPSQGPDIGPVQTGSAISTKMISSQLGGMGTDFRAMDTGPLLSTELFGPDTGMSGGSISVSPVNIQTDPVFPETPIFKGPLQTDTFLQVQSKKPTFATKEKLAVPPLQKPVLAKSDLQLQAKAVAHGQTKPVAASLFEAQVTAGKIEPVHVRSKPPSKIIEQIHGQPFVSIQKTPDIPVQNKPVVLKKETSGSMFQQETQGFEHVPTEPLFPDLLAQSKPILPPVETVGSIFPPNQQLLNEVATKMVLGVEKKPILPIGQKTIEDIQTKQMSAMLEQHQVSQGQMKPALPMKPEAAVEHIQKKQVASMLQEQQVSQGQINAAFPMEQQSGVVMQQQPFHQAQRQSITQQQPFGQAQRQSMLPPETHLSEQGPTLQLEPLNKMAGLPLQTDPIIMEQKVSTIPVKRNPNLVLQEPNLLPPEVKLQQPLPKDVVKERVRVSEAVINPSLVGPIQPKIHQALHGDQEVVVEVPWPKPKDVIKERVRVSEAVVSPSLVGPKQSKNLQLALGNQEFAVEVPGPITQDGFKERVRVSEAVVDSSLLGPIQPKNHPLPQALPQPGVQAALQAEAALMVPQQQALGLVQPEVNQAPAQTGQWVRDWEPAPRTFFTMP